MLEYWDQRANGPAPPGYTGVVIGFSGKITYKVNGELATIGAFNRYQEYLRLNTEFNTNAPINEPPPNAIHVEPITTEPSIINDTRSEMTTPTMGGLISIAALVALFMVLK